MDNEGLQLAVKRGAYYMDENYSNWASAINFDTFEMDNCQQCIVGQAVGEYGVAIGAASGYQPYSRDANEWAVEYGFDIPMAEFARSNEAANACYRELEELWTDQVRERLG